MIKEFQNENRWLSNFWYCKIPYEGIVFLNVECAYQAAKILNHKERIMISKMKPWDAKHYARAITNKRPNWHDINVEIMEDLLRLKFSNENPYLKDRLVATGDEYLQEGNLWHDKFWGVDLRTDKGENMLGKLIMKVRDDLVK